MFTPYLSYRVERSGGNIRDSGEEFPGGSLTRASSLVMLVHGYNNTQDEASGAYNRFLFLQKEIGQVSANMTGVYWPGDNWTGGLYYMEAIGKAKKVAPKLARDIYNAALALGFLEIDIIAHSLGCRLVLETIAELQLLQDRRPVPGLIINHVVFMAAAVPTFYLEENNHRLRKSLEQSGATLSLYSESDVVLSYAFPLGQTLAREGSYPKALGYTNWSMGSRLAKPVKQIRNEEAEHSDYWGGTSTNFTSQRKAAYAIRSFISLGPTLPREIEPRTLIAAHTDPARGIVERRIKSREIQAI